MFSLPTTKLARRGYPISRGGSTAIFLIVSNPVVSRLAAKLRHHLRAGSVDRVADLAGDTA
jgi:hypothetical protein